STVLYASAEGLASPPEGWRDLASALGRAQVGDSSGLEELAQRYFGERSDGTRELSVEAQLATLCADQHRLASVEAYRAALPVLAASSPHFGAANLLSHLPCAFWPEPNAGPMREPGARTLAPILVIANRDDPLTPHLWGERLAARFPSATRIDVESRGHTAFARGDACVDSLVERYLVAPAPPARTHCP
ncbi:MAG TPA: alpha/beta hydrolase, partial [Myxococcota bacterium]|nr:alpha/beta hydrolase [Myxococcota bacterium]